MYQVLYRKWRPKIFSDVVGQPHVTRTLQSEIQNNRLSHAYLFTGSRGTGKTTCAKILSKAVNCLHPVDGNPCNECEICRGIDNGSILDVVEIDAASNNGVDNIRDIRDEVNFTPASCKFRVYIIDEVHMLSDGAFNALLKTLEEPPEHVVFILATTEVHKLPATILSRCQRFDFRRIPSEDMAQRLEYVAGQENLILDREGAMLIARLADGALRDALSILDQCGTRDRHITESLVSDVAGLTGRVYLFELTDAVGSHDCAGALDVLNKLHNSSCDMERLCTELINHFRNLMIVKTVKSSAELIVCTEQELQQLLEQTKHFTLETVLYAMDVLQQALLNIKKGVNRRVEMEMTCIRLCSPQLSTDTKAIIRRLSVLEAAVQSGTVLAKAPGLAEPSDEAEGVPAVAEEVEETQAGGQEPMPQQAVPEPAKEKQAAITDFDRWPEVLTEIEAVSKPLWAVLIGSSAYIRGDKVIIRSDNPALGALIRTKSNAAFVGKAIENVTGKSYKLGLARSSADTSQTKKQDLLDGLIQKVSATDIKLTIND